MYGHMWTCSRPRAIAVALAGGSLLGLGLRLALFAAGAALVRRIGEASGAVPDTFTWLDPVYTHAALRSLADLQLQGLAVGGPPGAWLHAAWPDLFAEPDRAHWSLVRIVVERGSPVLARLLAAAVAHAGVLGLGLLIVRRGLRERHRPWLVWVGLAVQVQVALGILGAPPSMRDLEATGISFAANALLPWLALRGQALSDVLVGLWPPLVSALLVSLALMVGYLPSALVLVLRDRLWRVTLGTALAVTLSSGGCATLLREGVPTAAASGAVSPTTTSLVLESAPPAAQPVQSEAAELVLDRWYADDAPVQSVAAPSHVEVTGSNYQFQYLVNGEPQVIKGMGLNTQYAQLLSPSERRARLDADMAALAGLGVNTVLGWDPAEFDEVLLDAAQRHDIGVVMPFELDPEADYTDSQLRQQLREQVLAWVGRYRDHPALRMWGLGNEVLHKIVHPAWVGPQDAERERNAEAFSDWLIETADAIHRLDPDHPVTYRSAEDAFAPWVVAALNRAGGGPRPWFVFGTNCYQEYLSKIVDNWPSSGLPSALWVSEFAPGGMAVPDRPDGFEAMWGYVRRHPEWVLGGAVYAWTRNGPEGVDRNFGLTDDGEPVDGRSLDMLTALFHSE
jgi:hypothetical protein